MILKAGRCQFVFPRPTVIMGIVNVTPDSFADGGRYLEAEAAVSHARQLVREGAEIIDVGGESTRPGAVPVPEAEELRRVLPVIEALAGEVQVPLSIDTRKPAVARAALAAGASLVNDVAANREDDLMWRLVAAAGAGYVCMHAQGSPPTMPQRPHYDDVRREVGAFFTDRLARLAQAGVEPDHVILDVGIGFGKALEHNLDLLRHLEWFTRFERPLLLGVSRKSFVGKLLGAEVESRLPASLACAAWGVGCGVALLRTHDVAATWQAARMTEALRAPKT